MNDKKFELPNPEDSWAKVALWRWQYGTLPQPDDMRPLDVSAGLRGMAAAIRKGYETALTQNLRTADLWREGYKKASTSEMGKVIREEALKSL